MTTDAAMPGTAPGHLARELHDRIGGNLAAAHRQVELCRERTPSDSAADGAIRTAERLLKETLDDLRMVISGLRTVKPANDLGSELRSYAATAAPEGMAIDVVQHGDDRAAPATVREQALLIAREALRNALVHSGGSHTLVTVVCGPDSLSVAVTDDGVGLVPALMRTEHDCTGLLAMDERARLIGGRLSLTSRPGTGTRVELVAPFDGGGRHG